MIRVVLADDEPEACDGLARLVGEDRELTLMAQCGDGRSALDAIVAHDAGIVLLDIEMPGMSGLDVARALNPDAMPVIIFITAFDHYAVQAFAARAIGYLVKPFDDQQFLAAMRHAKGIHAGTVARDRVRRVDDLVSALDEIRTLAGTRRVEASASGVASTHKATPPLVRLLLKSADRIVLVPVDEVDWFEAADYYVRVHHAGEQHLIRETMTALEQRLDARRFLRIHRSAIVNIDRVRSLSPTLRGDHIVVLHDGRRLLLSRARKRRFEQAIGQRL